MIGFFKDPNLQTPADPNSPAYLFLPERGGHRELGLYLGIIPRRLRKLAASGSTTLELDYAEDLPASGQVHVDGLWITYGARSGSVLQSIPSGGAGSVSRDLAYNTRAFPIVNPSGSNLAITPVDLSISNDRVDIQIKKQSDPEIGYSIAGGAILFPHQYLNPHRNLQRGFHFRESIGTSVLDYSSNQSTGTLTGAVTRSANGFTPGSGSCRFSGGTASLGSLTGGTTGTLELWVNNYQSSTWLQWGTKVTLSTDNLNVLTVRAVLQNSAVVTLTGPTLLNSWHHVAITWDSDLRLYIDGVQYASTPIGAVLNPSGSIILGQVSSDFAVDELRIYDRVLSSEGVCTRSKGAGLLDFGVPSAGLDLRVRVYKGSRSSWAFRLATSEFHLQENGTAVSAYGSCMAIRETLSLRNTFRMYPSTKISEEVPGFVIGQHRWRSEQEVNAHAVLDTRWDISPEVIGREKFIAGVGHRDDLSVVGIEKTAAEPNSIRTRLKYGEYFTGADRYFLPATPEVEILRAEHSAQTLHLQKTPASQRPVFLGTFQADHTGYYDAKVRYRPVQAWDSEDSGYQCKLDRTNRTIETNKGLLPGTLYLGVASGSALQAIDSPLFPIWNVKKVYTDRPYEEIPEDVNLTTSPSYRYDAQAGVFSLKLPPEYASRGVFVDYDPAVVAIYDSSLNTSHLVTDVDLNPAFSGIASGYLYLQHRNQRIKFLELFADKPRLPIPPAYQNYTGSLAFGPVYNKNDYALVLVSAYGYSEKDKVLGKRLQILVEPGWKGTLNYQDPLQDTVEVVTGGDGSASLVYLPAPSFGYYLHQNSISNAEATLPVSVSFDQLWNLDDGWRTRFYLVYSNHPYLGKKNAKISQGEIPWKETGVAGTSTYETNGRRVIWGTKTTPIYPVNAKDSNDTLALTGNAINPAFNGFVQKLVFSGDIPTDADIGSYFVTYPGRVALRAYDPETGVTSNYVVLQLDDPPVYEEVTEPASFLRLADASNGRLNINRLGGGPIPAQAFFSRRF